MLFLMLSLQNKLYKFSFRKIPLCQETQNILIHAYTYVFHYFCLYHIFVYIKIIFSSVLIKLLCPLLWDLLSWYSNNGWTDEVTRWANWQEIGSKFIHVLQQIWYHLCLHETLVFCRQSLHKIWQQIVDRNRTESVIS